MLWFIVILVAAGCVLAIISLFSSSEEKGWKESHHAHQDAMERALTSLRDQLYTLEFDVKQNIRLTTDIAKEMKELKERSLALYKDTAITLDAKAAEKAFNYYKQDIGQLEQTQKKCLTLEEENEKLTQKVSFLIVQIDDMTKERDAQKRLIIGLREREEGIYQQLQQMRAEYEDLKRGLEAATRSKLEMKDKLFKLRVISSDSEKELERLRAENKELMDHLSYERNS